jgi:ankyrin repeat protein
MKKWLIALLVIGTLIGGGWWYFRYGGGSYYFFHGKSEKQFEIDRSLSKAIENHDFVSAQQLIAEGADINALVNAVGDNAITKAIVKGDLEAIKFLLDHGANTTVWGTPLDYAVSAFKGMFNIPYSKIKEIIQYMVDLKVPNKEQPEILTAIIIDNFEKVKELLKEIKSKEISHENIGSIRWTALRSGNLTVVKYLAQEIPELTSFNEETRPFLEEAVNSNDLEMVKYALSIPHVDISAPRNNGGYSPFQMAIVNGEYFDTSKIVEFLIKQGARLDESYYQAGDTPLDLAKKTNNPKVIELIQRYQ